MFKRNFLTSVASKATVTLALLTLSSTGFAGGGSAPGGGGGGGGTACSVISKFTVTSGPAQWTFPFDDVTITYILKGCSPGFVPAGTVTVTNLDGATAPSYYGPSVMTGNVTGLLGKIRLWGWNLTPYNANIRVDFVVKNPATGAVVDSQSITLVTPPKV